MSPNLHIYPSPEELAERVAEELMALFGQSHFLAFHVAISGGKTPNLLFSVLSDKYGLSALWNKIHFWWVDERMVSPDDAESNYGTAQKLLFSQIAIPKENIHRIKGENDPNAEALSYSQQIKKMVPLQKGWPIFDLVLLGMGDDGHTASIFPDQLFLLDSSQICEVAIHPQSRQKRVTLTGRVINNAARVWFLITGAGKADKFKTILRNDNDAHLLPAAHIKPLNGALEWHADQQAAAKAAPGQ